jgi:hypothetical protein
MPAPDAISADMAALDTAPGTGDVRFVPLRESTLALVGTLLVVKLETRTATNPTPGRASSSDSEPGNVARPDPRRATPWEHFVIGLDRHFDQFRRTFREPPEPGDNGEPQMESGAAPSAWDHLRATDEALASGWPEDAASSLAGRSGISDPEGSRPIQVSLSQVALALGVGYACWRRPRPRQACSNTRDVVRLGFLAR